MKQKFIGLVAGICLGLAISGSVFAGTPVERSNTNTLWFESWGALTNATLTVVSPDGERQAVFTAAGSPTFHLRDMAPVMDGVYTYELSAATDEMITLKNQLDSGRGAAQKTQINKPFHLNGYFFVTRGVISMEEKYLEE